MVSLSGLDTYGSHTARGRRYSGSGTVSMRVEAILAASRNGVIGDKGGLPWRLPEDLKRFRSLTRGQITVMGRKTYEGIYSALGRPLDERLNVVFTSRANAKYGIGPTVNDGYSHVEFIKGDVIKVIRSLKEFDSWDEAVTEDKDGNIIPFTPSSIFVIGGASIYTQALPCVSRIHLTLLKDDYEGDTRLDLKTMLEPFMRVSVEPGAECDYVTYYREPPLRT